MSARRPWTPGPVPHTLGEFACIDFVNSEFNDHRGGGGSYDRLGLEPWWEWFVERWNLGPRPPLDPQGLAEMRRLRALMRTILVERRLPDVRETEVLNRVLAEAPFTWRLDIAPSGGRLLTRPAPAGTRTALAGVVLSLAELLLHGDPARVKRCGNPSCSFVYYDGTRNGSRRWCDPHLCGNLVKVRAFRYRQGTSAPPPR